MKASGLLLTSLAIIAACPAFAADLMVPAAMQRCTSDAECTMVSNSCNNVCADLPVNSANLSTIETLRAQRCTNPATEATQECTTHPPLEAACINNRCTISYAYQTHGDAQDYKPGAYPVPESPVPSQTTQDYSGVNDRDGNFNAYDLPEDVVRQNALGQYKMQNPNAQTDTAPAQ